MYISVYRDSTGWSRAASDYILALDAAGVTVVPRPLKLNGDHFEIPARIRELEQNDASQCDVVIQHVLPHTMEYHSGFKKNIGLFASETSDFRWSHWPEHLNLMDEVWVINHQQVIACKQSGVTRPIKVVPHATDVTRFQQSYEPIAELNAQLEGNFAFYTIGEMVRRKNLAALVKAFHLEFGTSEPVSLVIKTSKQGSSPTEVASAVEALCNEVKRGLKLYKHLQDYHSEHVITQRLNDEGILRLHSTCDCFVSPSFGEAWCIPAFDAMSMGRTPICTGCTGFLDYVPGGGLLINGFKEPVFGMIDTFSDLFTGRETWTQISISGLRQAMRDIYENKNGLRDILAQKGVARAYDFSYDKVGQTMRNYLES